MSPMTCLSGCVHSWLFGTQPMQGCKSSDASHSFLQCVMKMPLQTRLRWSLDSKIQIKCWALIVWGLQGEGTCWALLNFNGFMTWFHTLNLVKSPHCQSCLQAVWFPILFNMLITEMIQLIFFNVPSQCPSFSPCAEMLSHLAKTSQNLVFFHDLWAQFTRSACWPLCWGTCFRRQQQCLCWAVDLIINLTALLLARCDSLEAERESGEKGVMVELKSWGAPTGLGPETQNNYACRVWLHVQRVRQL